MARRPPAPLLFEGYLSFLPGLPRLLAWLSGFAAVTGIIASLIGVLLFLLIKALVRRPAAAAVGSEHLLER